MLWIPTTALTARVGDVIAFWNSAVKFLAGDYVNVLKLSVGISDLSITSTAISSLISTSSRAGKYPALVDVDSLL